MHNILLEITDKTFTESRCPPAIGSELYWKHTNVIFHGDSLNMLKGSVVEYTCIGDLQMEGQEGENRTLVGNVTCQDDLTWDKSVSLPCTREYTVDHRDTVF